MYRFVPAFGMLLFCMIFIQSCLTSPDAPEVLPVSITAVEFTGDYTWQSPQLERSSDDQRFSAERGATPGKSLACQFTVHWTLFEGTGFKAYRVYRSGEPGIPGNPEGRILLGSVYSDSTLEYSDSRDLEWEGVYYYRIRLDDVFGDSWWSNEVSVTAPAVEHTGSAMESVTGCTLSLVPSGYNGFELSWTPMDPEPFVSYTLFRRLTEGIPENPVGAQAIYESAQYSDTTFTDIGLESRTDYYYALKVVVGLGSTAWSNEVHGLTSHIFPDRFIHIEQLGEESWTEYMPIDRDGDYVYFVDMENGTVRLNRFSTFSWDIMSVSLGPYPGPGGMGPLEVTPDGQRVFVATGLPGEKSLLVFRTWDLSPDGSYPLLWDIEWLHVPYPGDELYVKSNGSIRVVSTDDLSDIATISIPPSSVDNRLGSDPDGSRVYCSADYSMLVIDPQSHSVMADVPTTVYNCVGLECSRDGSTLYAVSLSGRMVELDTSNNTVIRECALGIPAGGMCLLGPDDRFMYVTNYFHGGPLAHVFDLLTIEEEAEISGDGANPCGFPVASDPEGDRIILLGTGGGLPDQLHVLSRDDPVH